MNQTDWQGETERALRALDERITNYLASGGLFNPESMEHVKVRELLRDCRELLPLFNAGIAEAYAAAAKHWPMIGYCFSLYTLECSCGWRGKGSWKHVDKEQFHKEWTEHILALTPADARQAHEQHDTEIVEATHKIWMQQLGTPDRSGIPEDIGTIARAAIASAEVRARLEEVRKWKPVKCFDVSHHPLRSPMCKTCQQMARWEERIAELEAAARTPDSTKEPE